MISEECRSAARKLSGYRQLLKDDGPGPSTTHLLSEIVKMHERCRGGTWCDCQCATGVSLISQAKEEALPR